MFTIKRKYIMNWKIKNLMCYMSLQSKWYLLTSFFYAGSADDQSNNPRTSFVLIYHEASTSSHPYFLMLSLQIFGFYSHRNFIKCLKG